MEVLIPRHLVKEFERMHPAIFDIAKEFGEIKKDDLQIIKPKQFAGGDTPATLVISSAVLAWFTKKWADTYLWPEIQKRIENPSKEVVEWIIRVISKSTK